MKNEYTILSNEPAPERMVKIVSFDKLIKLCDLSIENLENWFSEYLYDAEIPQGSVFNNNSKIFVDGDVVDGNNQVITYDFKLDEYSYYLNDSLINNDVRTITEGRSQILQNGDLFVEETNFGRILYFNSDGSLRWTYVNRADNNKNYVVSWSRVLYNKKDIQSVINFLQSKRKCQL